jgi:hypothetical protein
MPLPHLPYKQLAASLALALPVLFAAAPDDSRHAGVQRSATNRIDFLVRQAAPAARHGSGQ